MCFHSLPLVPFSLARSLSLSPPFLPLTLPSTTFLSRSRYLSYSGRRRKDVVKVERIVVVNIRGRTTPLACLLFIKGSLPLDSYCSKLDDECTSDWLLGLFFPYNEQTQKRTVCRS